MMITNTYSINSVNSTNIIIHSIINSVSTSSDEADGPMIECANVQCPFNRWFHYKCVGKKDSWKVPDVWYCVRCKTS